MQPIGCKRSKACWSVKAFESATAKAPRQQRERRTAREGIAILAVVQPRGSKDGYRGGTEARTTATR